MSNFDYYDEIFLSVQFWGSSHKENRLVVTIGTAHAVPRIPRVFGDLRDERKRLDRQKERNFQSAFDTPDINRGMETKTSSTDILDGQRSSKFIKFVFFFRILYPNFPLECIEALHPLCSMMKCYWGIQTGIFYSKKRS